MAEYTTVSGDTWDYISFKAFGSHKYTPRIIEMNEDYIYTVVFDGGIRLALPDPEPAAAANMPPWRK